jgi:hypothetical protein
MSITASAIMRKILKKLSVLNFILILFFANTGQSFSQTPCASNTETLTDGTNTDLYAIRWDFYLDKTFQLYGDNNSGGWIPNNSGGNGYDTPNWNLYLRGSGDACHGPVKNLNISVKVLGADVVNKKNY